MVKPDSGAVGGRAKEFSGERMPKRDDVYMGKQRLLIAQVALECMLEKGVGGTTLRDVCERASVSMGALYVHFETRDDLVLAACTVDPLRAVTPVGSWAEYVGFSRAHLTSLLSNERRRRRMRVSMEFVASRILDTENPPGSQEAYASTYEYFEESLKAIHENGEITLPLGLAQTARIHCQMEAGAGYILLADKSADPVLHAETLAAGLAITAGYVGVSNPAGAIATNKA